MRRSTSSGSCPRRPERNPHLPRPSTTTSQPPTITSISTDGGPLSLANEDGGSVITIKGTGFNFAGLEWVNFGDPSFADSQDFGLVTVTGKEIQIEALPFETETTDLEAVPVSIKTIAGQSGSVDATYAGIPTVDAATATVRSDHRGERRARYWRHPDRRHRRGFCRPGRRRRVRRCARPVLDRHAVPLHGAQQHRSHVVDGAAEPGTRRRRGLHGDGVLLPVALAGGRVPPLPAGRSEDRLESRPPRGLPRAVPASRSPARTSAV